MSVAIASSLYKPPVSTTSKNAAEINIQLSGSLSRKKYLIQDKTQHIKNNNTGNSNNKSSSLKKSARTNSNSRSVFFSYIYANTNTILNKFVMSYEEQLQRAITRGNLELCQELIDLKCDINIQINNKLPICLACEYNQYEIVELLIKVC
jgi:ankyrin repeat protein